MSKTKMIIHFEHTRLKDTREQKGFKTTYALAKKMGIAAHQIDRAEKTGRINMNTFINLCEAMEAHPATFFTLEYREENGG